MEVQGYDQIMRVSSPPTANPGQNGLYAFSESNGRLYRFYGSNWEMVPNQAELTAAARQGYVSGVVKKGLFPYLCKATSVNGTLTFYITDNGLETGNAVYTEIIEDGITISPYGTATAYQLSAPVVSADKKKVTCNITQAGAVVLGLITTVTAANGVDCRAIIMGK